jgi:hypothetical protein
MSVTKRGVSRTALTLSLLLIMVCSAGSASASDFDGIAIAVGVYGTLAAAGLVVGVGNGVAFAAESDSQRGWGRSGIIIGTLNVLASGLFLFGDDAVLALPNLLIGAADLGLGIANVRSYNARNEARIAFAAVPLPDRGVSVRLAVTW